MSTKKIRGWRIVAATVLLSAGAVLLLGSKEVPAPPPEPAAPTVSCEDFAALSPSDAVEQCHLKYKAYTLDTTNTFAQETADRIGSTLTQAECTSTLDIYHTDGQTLLDKYPGALSVAENLACAWNSIGCASASVGATNAMNGWVASTVHKANLDSFAGKSVNAAVSCNVSTNISVAVGQFHNP